MNRFKSTLFTAIFIATALTFSCSSDSGGDPSDGGDSSSGGGGTPSSSSVVVPSSSSTNTPSSSSVVVPSSSSGSTPSSSSVSVPSSSSSEGGNGNTFMDSRDGKTYKWVKIGTQTWMAENLNYNASNSRCYDNDPGNCDIYGRLYHWTTAITICPDGWHLPSDDEWTILTDFVGANAGTKLKATSGWNNNTGTDEFDFSALPGGNSETTGGGLNFYSYNVGNGGYWWSATEIYTNYAWKRDMGADFSDVARSFSTKSGGASSYLLSVRCVRD